MVGTEERRPSDQPSRVERSVVGTVGVASLCWLAIMFPKYLGRFSGDAMIHLTFSERITEGRWLEFNRGEASAGTTSFLWNIVESLALAHLPDLPGDFRTTDSVRRCLFGEGAGERRCARAGLVTSRW